MYLKEDIGFRYEIIDKDGTLSFLDNYAGDTFKFDGDEWV
jgi:hypothetical protein